MKNYEAILFDGDDTLLDFAAGEASVCRYPFEHLPDHPALPFDSFTMQFHHIEDAMWDLYMAGTIHCVDVLPAIFDRLASTGLASFFEAVVISDDIGIEKPDPGIFDAALRQLHLKPHQCLFVGNSVSADAAGARSAGIDFCWYTRHHADFPLRHPVPSHP